MNDQDKKILELYLKDVRKKKIIFLTIVVSIITSVLLYGLYEKYKKNTNNEQNYIESNVEENVSNENSIEETNLNTENKIIVENTEKTEDNTSLIVKEDTKQDSKEENKKNTQNINISNNNKNTKAKPTNKDFLFTDGYTMENVTQAAQRYLKSFNTRGECVPIKDNEGVYLGMRVIFY